MHKSALNTIVISTLLLTLTACGGNAGKQTSSTPVVSSTTQNNSSATSNNPFVVKNIKSVITETTKEDDRAITQVSYQIGNTTYPDGNGIDFAKFDTGLTQTAFSTSTTETGKTVDSQNATFTYETAGKFYLFKQDYSALAAFANQHYTAKENGTVLYTDDLPSGVDFVFKGVPTTTLPISGAFNYQGSAHLYGDDEHFDGTTNYRIDFDKKLGSGTLSFADNKNIVELAQARIGKYTIHNTLDDSYLSTYGIQNGQATYQGETGSYTLGIFGANAKEIIGHIDIGGSKDMTEGGDFNGSHSDSGIGDGEIIGYTDADMNSGEYVSNDNYISDNEYAKRFTGIFGGKKQ